MRSFKEVYDKLPANGWLNEAEAQLLWRCCVQTTGPILEVGCYYGRSTCLLAEFGRPLYCVDPFSNFDSDDPSGDKIMDKWFDNTKSVREYVTLYRCKIEDWEPMPVDLAYLDGDHTFEGTLAQINKALMCGPLVIAVHDYASKPVKLACDERLDKPRLTAERLAVWRYD